MKWIPGTVTKILAPLAYIVELPENNRRVVHAEHMIPRDDMLSVSPVPSPDSLKCGELLPANTAPLLDKPHVSVEPTRPPAVVQTPVRCSQPQVNTPVDASEHPRGCS